MTRRPAPDRALQDIVESFLRAESLTGARIAIALSGGLDSVVLTDLLADLAGALDLRLSALHVHHGLSPHADAWAQACAALCSERRIDLVVERVHIDRDDRRGIEAAARAARYDAFRRLDADAVALAHHADDQAETVLLQLLRGAGPPGLAAMPASRTLDSGVRLIRPLLSLPRSRLVSHANARGLAWVEDESNDDARYRRNALRQHVLPGLEQWFPGYRTTFARAADNAADAARLAAALAAIDLPSCESGDELLVSGLSGLDDVRRINVVRHWLRARGVDAPSRESLLEGVAQLLSAGANAQPAFAFGSHRLLRYRDRLRLVSRDALKAGWSIDWDGGSGIALPDGRTLRLRHVAGQGLRAGAMTVGAVRVAGRRGGERMRLGAGRPRRTLKNLLQEAGIPAWERERLVIVRIGERVAWVSGVGIDPDFAAGPGEPGVMPEFEV